MGDYLVDVSNDTVDVSKSKVDISKLKEIQFKNITTFEEFIAVKERYHDVKIYINNIVPHIFSDYPLFERNKSGGLTIIQNPCCKYLIDVLKVFPPENLPKIKGDEAKRIKHFFSMKSKIFETEEQKKATIHKMVALYNFSK